MSAPTAPATTAGVPVARAFARTVAAEWTRLWTVQATWWFLAAAAVVMVGIATLAGLDVGGDPSGAQGDPAWTIVPITLMPAQFGLLALALSAVTADHATGGIVPTLQWTPRRGVLFLARWLVAAATTTALAALLGLAAGLAAFTAAGSVLTLPLAEGLDAIGTVAFVAAAGACLAVGLGFALRNTAGGLVSLFLLMLVLPILLPQFGYEWTTAIAEVLPGSGAAFLLLGAGDVLDMTQTRAVVVLLGWAAGALLLGWLRLLRHDANR
jgi:ABC-2 type transport system permease protein